MDVEDKLEEQEMGHKFLFLRQEIHEEEGRIVEIEEREKGMKDYFKWGNSVPETK